MKTAFYLLCITLLVSLFEACSSSNTIEGKWQYDGGIYNGKLTKASADYQMQRTYTDQSYDAYLIEPGADPEKYGAGVYEIKADTFKVTSTYSNQNSQSTGKTINYLFKIEGNQLTIRGTLPNGMQVEEYWKRVD